MVQLSVQAPNNSQNIEATIHIRVPRQRVFEAYIYQEILTQWWGQGKPVEAPVFEAHDGGSWQLVQRDADGGEHVFCGSFHEVLYPERIVWTVEFLGMAERGHVALARYDFAELSPNETRITVCSTFQSVEDRDGMMGDDMEEGWLRSLEKLAEVVGGTPE